MKKNIILLLSVIVCFTSCSQNAKTVIDYKNILKQYGDDVFIAFQEDDVEKIKGLFSVNQQKNYSNFNEDIYEALDFLGKILGDYEEIKYDSVCESIRDGKTVKYTGFVEMTGIKTEKGTYSIHANVMLVNEDDKSWEGIQRLIIKNSKYKIDINNLNYEDTENIRYIGELMEGYN